MEIDCYAQRLLNPFRGAVHTIKYAAAEAATLDGVNWDIYIANEQLLEGLEVSRWTQISDVRYGKWMPGTGLKRGAIYPSDDFHRMEEMGAVVYQHLTRVYRQVPFKFKDIYELWLLDTTGEPLALLHSVIEKKDIAFDFSVQWCAGQAAKVGFSSPIMEELGVTGREELAASEYLARCVNGQAGETPAAQWFLRNEDGSGTGLEGINMQNRNVARVLGPEAFPALLLSSAGLDAPHRRLVEDFQAWQSPWLLVLPGLDFVTRRELEQKAREHALELQTQYRLYPQTIDEGTINAALVESLLRKSQPVPGEISDNTISPYYIELLNPGPTD